MVNGMPRWDRHAIKAEIYRRGQTLTGLARQAGLADNAIRMALMGKRWARAEQVIADFIGVPAKTLFPLPRNIPLRSTDSGTSRRRWQRRGAPGGRRTRGGQKKAAARPAKRTAA